MHYRTIPIGVITFHSAEPHAFDFQLQQLLASFVRSLEDYLREFLAAHDARWLSITAGAYHNLHELRQISSCWADVENKEAVKKTISAFDQTFDGDPGSLFELQDYFDSHVENQIQQFPAPFRPKLRKAAALRCRFSVLGHPEFEMLPIPRTTIELIKRVFTNLLTDFALLGRPGSIETFSISTQVKPCFAIRLRQEQNRCFPEKWFSQLGFQPMHDNSSTKRLHHGLFLCSAIARYLGGFSWIGNMNDRELGPRSVVELIIPLTEPT
jgi:hypothetical protein